MPYELMTCERDDLAIRAVVDYRMRPWFSVEDIMVAMNYPDTTREFCSQIKGCKPLRIVSRRQDEAAGRVRADRELSIQGTEFVLSRLKATIVPGDDMPMASGRTLNALMALGAEHDPDQAENVISWLQADVSYSLNNRGYYFYEEDYIPTKLLDAVDAGLAEKPSAKLEPLVKIASDNRIKPRALQALLVSAGMLTASGTLPTMLGYRFAVRNDDGDIKWPVNIRDVVRSLS